MSNSKVPLETSLTSENSQISGTNYQMVPIQQLNLVERPEDGTESEVVFFNPRDLASFTPDKMNALAYNIRAEGLQQPPIVRLLSHKDSTTSFELIAGERRYRVIKSIYDNDLPCFHEDAAPPKFYKKDDVVLCKGRFGVVIEQKNNSVIISFEDDEVGTAEKLTCNYADVFPTISGRELYGNVPCRIVRDCTDERALRLAFTENDKSEPLTTAEEISLVERLYKMGKNQDEISQMLGVTKTWVSQTGNFRRHLPEGAFEKLTSGNMARHVAINLLSYPEEKRQELYTAAIEVAEIEVATKIDEIQQRTEQLEDLEEDQKAEIAKAEKTGNLDKAEEAKRKAAVLAQKAKKEHDRLKRVKDKKPHLTQSHVKKGATKSGIIAKKAKPFDIDEIENVFVKGILPYLDGDGVDKITGHIVPADMAAIVRRTALAIINGIPDPVLPIRSYMQENGNWATDQEDELPPLEMPKKGKAYKKSHETIQAEVEESGENSSEENQDD